MKKKSKRTVLSGKHDYDFRNDDLYTFMTDRKYSTSFQVGDLIFDLDIKNKFVGVEILDASNVMGIPKDHLRHILGGKIAISSKKKEINIHMELMVLVRNTRKTRIFHVNETSDEEIASLPMEIELPQR